MTSTLVLHGFIRCPPLNFPVILNLPEGLFKRRLLAKIATSLFALIATFCKEAQELLISRLLLWNKACSTHFLPPVSPSSCSWEPGCFLEVCSTNDIVSLSIFLPPPIIHKLAVSQMRKFLALIVSKPLPACQLPLGCIVHFFITSVFFLLFLFPPFLVGGYSTRQQRQE